MGKQKNAVNGGGKTPSSHSPTLSSWVSKAEDPCDAVQDLRDQVASLEAALSQMGTSSQMPFQFTQCNGSPSEQSLLLEHQADPSTSKDWMHYHVHVRATLGEGRGNQPLTSHVWTSSLITDIFQEGLEEKMTKAMVLAPGEAILFFERWSLKEGVPHKKQRILHLAWQAQLFGLGDRPRWRLQSIQCKRVTEPLQMQWWKIGWKLKGQDVPEGKGRPIRPLLWHATSKSGCKASKRMILRWSWGMKEWGIGELSQGTHSLRMLVGGEYVIEDKADHHFLRMLQGDLPLPGGKFQLRKWSKFPSVDPDQRIQGKQQTCLGRKRSNFQG